MRRASQPIQVTVLRPPEPANRGGRPGGAQAADDSRRFQSHAELGLVMTMGPITAVEIGSPAEHLGLHPGETIAAMGTGDVYI